MANKISNVHTPYSDAQIAVWLRGLLTVAWADGHFDPEEQAIITGLTQELAATTNLGTADTIDSAQLAAVFGKNTAIAENFMRTAVMVAIADGLYSPSEDAVLHEFCTVLGLDPHILESLRSTLHYQPANQPADQRPDLTLSGLEKPESPGELLKPMQDWLDHLEITDPRVARFLCQMIPPQCPFERDVVLFGHKLVHIPAMCKINPLYEQLVGLRFRSLSYLADECHEDVSKYC
ncbi:MAG TPA: Mo-dependent nitrogenase C-terminal domain-containing protein [Coleofasciculaceae cyanobacterium]